MRVTFVLKSADMAGGVRVIAVYAQALRAMGHEVTVVSAPRAVGSLKRRVKRLLTAGSFAKHYPAGPSHFDGLGLDCRVLPEAREVRAGDVPDADVVVATWWETAEWVSGFPASKGSPVYLIQHDERVFMHMDEAQRRRVEATWALPMRRVVVAQWLADLLEEHGAGPSTVILNAVDAGLFYAPVRGKQAVPTVGYMYSPVTFKGADLAREAIEIARESVPELRVVAFGHDDPEAQGGPGGPGLPAGTAYTRSPDQGQLRALYASCDAWLFASRCEGFGLPILEAMACRTPVIGVPTGAAPQLLAGGAGWPVAMDDPAAMAAQIVAVSELTAVVWRTVSENAHAVATGTTWADAARRFAGVLAEASGVGGG